MNLSLALNNKTTQGFNGCPSCDFVYRYLPSDIDSTGVYTGSADYRIGKVGEDSYTVSSNMFDGSTQYYTENASEISGIGLIGENALTIGLWINTFKTSIPIFEINDSTTTGGLLLSIDASGQPVVTIEGSANTITDFSSISNGVWHYVAIRLNGSGEASYLNLDSVNSTSFAPIYNFNVGTNSLVIGYDGSSFYSGRVDDLRVYGKELMDSEVTTLYNFTHDFNLSQVASDMRVLYETQDHTTITSVTGGVSLHEDQSSNGDDVEQGNSSSRPTTDSRTINNINVFDYNGSSDVLTNLVNNDYLQDVSSGVIIAVVKCDTIPTDGENDFIFHVEGGSSSFARMALAINPTNWQVGGRRLDGDSNQSVNGPAATTDATILVGVLDYTNAEAYFLNNGTATTPVAFQTAGNSSDTTAGGISIGASVFNILHFDGLIGTSMILEDNTTLSYIQKIIGFLAWEYGLVSNLPVGHDYKTEPPKE